MNHSVKTSVRGTYRKLRRRAPVLYTIERRFRRRDDAEAIARFLRDPSDLTFQQRQVLVDRIRVADNQLDCAHTQAEILEVMRLAIPLADSPGVIVEAGSFKGGSAAKLSILAKMLGKELHIFDSFEGIPENEEDHRTSLFGMEVAFPQGDYAGTLDEVRSAIDRYGELSVCTFHQGLFAETMPSFDKPVSVAYVDVDLAGSTRDCVKHLYPLLEPGGALLSQDGHLPLVIDVLEDRSFWRGEVGMDQPPELLGLGTKKLVTMPRTG